MKDSHGPLLHLFLSFHVLQHVLTLSVPNNILFSKEWALSGVLWDNNDVQEYKEVKELGDEGFFEEEKSVLDLDNVILDSETGLVTINGLKFPAEELTTEFLVESLDFSVEDAGKIRKKICNPKI